MNQPKLTIVATETELPRPALDLATVHALRIRSEDLFGKSREIEIDHSGRIYRLRLTQLNKLILTA
jgi:hemin uptake protein HemP